MGINRISKFFLGALTALALLLNVASPNNASAQVTEFTVPTAASSPFGIITGPDDNLWFTEFGTDKIAKLTTAGVFTEFSFSAGFGPAGLTEGPDGNMWVCGFSGNKIAKVTTAGVITEFTVPTAASAPRSIVSGPDGNLWFTENSGNKIGKITTGGSFTEYAIPTAASSPRGIAVGSDGNLWFAESATDKIGRITTAGAITEYTLPTAGAGPRNIISGPDGALWFSEQNVNRIGRITTAGLITESLIPTATSFPSGLVVGPNGTGIWFTETAAGANKIGQISPLGNVVGETAVTTAGAGPEEITVGPDGNLWFTEYTGNKIGKLVPSNVLTVSTTSPLTAGTLGSAYSQTLAATGGTTPYIFWQVLSGSLPSGMLLSSAGVLGGVPTAAGASTFTVEVTDDQLVTASKEFSLTVNDPRPDLEGSVGTITRTASEVRGTVTVQNTGTNAASTSFLVDVYFSNDNVLSGSDVRVKRQRVRTLASGASKNVRYRFSRTRTRNKFILLVIDSGSTIDEADETNNQATRQIS